MLDSLSLVRYNQSISRLCQLYSKTPPRIQPCWSNHHCFMGWHLMASFSTATLLLLFLNIKARVKLLKPKWQHIASLLSYVHLLLISLRDWTKPLQDRAFRIWPFPVPSSLLILLWPHWPPWCPLTVSVTPCLCTVVLWAYLLSCQVSM